MEQQDASEFLIHVFDWVDVVRLPMTRFFDAGIDVVFFGRN